MKTNVIEYKKCIICTSNEPKIVYSWKKNYYNPDKYETCSWDARYNLAFNIVRCKKCKHMYTYPSIKKEFLSNVYPQDLINNNVKPSELKSDKKFLPIINIISKYKDSKNDLIVDIGTRYGTLPYMLRQGGYRFSFGIELNKSSVEISKKLDESLVFEGELKNNLQNILTSTNKENVRFFVFDDVLEHLIDPNIELAIMSKYQKKGDFIILRQMDNDSLGRKLYRKKWYYYQSAAHMHYFDRRSLENLLKKYGYKIILIQKPSFFRNIQLFFRQIFMKKRTVKFNNGKFHYLNERKKLRDIYTYIVVKE